MWILLDHIKGKDTKLNIPNEVQQETNKYFSSCDVVKDFLEDNYTLVSDEHKDKFFVKHQDLYKHYQRSNTDTISKTNFKNITKIKKNQVSGRRPF